MKKLKTYFRLIVKRKMTLSVIVKAKSLKDNLHWMFICFYL